MAGRQVYTSTEVCAISGLTYRRLHRWGALGALAPSVRPASWRGKGSPAVRAGLYSREDLSAAMVLGRLVECWPKKEIPVDLVVRIVETVRAGDLGASLVIALGPRVEIVVGLQGLGLGDESAA